MRYKEKMLQWSAGNVATRRDPDGEMVMAALVTGSARLFIALHQTNIHPFDRLAAVAWCSAWSVCSRKGDNNVFVTVDPDNAEQFYLPVKVGNLPG